METVQLEIHRDIIEQSKQGDRKAQYQLYNLYARAMLNVSYRMMRNREEAEDMLQEAFAEAFRNLERFRFESGFGSWLKRIVINRCINQIQKRKADLQFFDDMQMFDEHTEDDLPQAGLSVENIKKAMEVLPGGSRMIFSLYLLEGYDHGEISEILNISESTSKSQYMRAKNKVREILSNEYEN